MLGYNHPKIKEAVTRQLQTGPIFSLPHPIEVECAELIIEVVPCAEMVRFLKTGSEATQAAVRIARAFTERERIIRGHYHGWHEWCIAGTIKDGGIPRAYREFAFEAHYNNLDEYKEIFIKHKGEIAAVVIEPIEFEEPKDGFLSDLKHLCYENDALLIFDEVVTGFRFSLGGAQDYFDVTLDICAWKQCRHFLVQMAVDYSLKGNEQTDIAVIHAYVKQHNEVSSRSFVKAGFRSEGTTVIRGHQAIDFVLKKDKLI